MKNFIVNKTDKEVTLLIYGEIGAKIDGDLVAQYVNDISNQVNLIKVRVNSPGGAVFQGISIFNALYNSPAKVHVYIDGLAASIASIFAFAADRVFMNDFARIMIHNAHPKGKAQVSARDQVKVDNATGMIRSILSKRGIPEDQVENLMNKETWFNSTEALDSKLIDEIITTGKQIQVSNELELVAIAAKYEPFIEKSNNTNHIMKDVLNKLGLGPDASEEVAVAKLTEVQTTLETVQNELTAIKAEKAALETKVSETRKSSLLGSIENAVKAKQIDETKKTSLLAKVEAGEFDTVEAVLEYLPEPSAHVKDFIIPGGKKKVEAEEKETFAYLQEHNPEKLREIEASNPELFETMLDTYEAELA